MAALCPQHGLALISELRFCKYIQGLDHRGTKRAPLAHLLRELREEAANAASLKAQFSRRNPRPVPIARSEIKLGMRRIEHNVDRMEIEYICSLCCQGALDQARVEGTDVVARPEHLLRNIERVHVVNGDLPYRTHRMPGRKQTALAKSLLYADITVAVFAQPPGYQMAKDTRMRAPPDRSRQHFALCHEFLRPIRSLGQERVGRQLIIRHLQGAEGLSAKKSASARNFIRCEKFIEASLVQVVGIESQANHESPEKSAQSVD